METIYRELLEVAKNDLELKDHFVIRCYESWKMYEEKDRQKVMDKFEEGIICSEGSERERYTNIYFSLKNKFKIIFDDEWEREQYYYWYKHNEKERKSVEKQVGV